MKLKDYYRFKVVLNSSKVIEQKKPGQCTDFKFNSTNPDFYNIKYFQLIPEGNNLPSLILSIPPKARIIWFRRTVFHQGRANFTMHIYMAGWQTTVKRFGARDVNIKHILYFYPDGTIEDCPGEPTLLDLKIKAIEDEILKQA